MYVVYVLHFSKYTSILTISWPVIPSALATLSKSRYHFPSVCLSLWPYKNQKNYWPEVDASWYETRYGKT